MRFGVRIAAAALLLSGCQAETEVSASDAWVRLPATPGGPGAAYFTVHGGGEPATLLQVSAPMASSTELQENQAQTQRAGSDVTVRMVPIPRMEVPAGGTLTLSPTTRHVLLLGVSGDARPGYSAPISLHFAGGRTIELQARLVGANERMPAPK